MRCQFRLSWIIIVLAAIAGAGSLAVLIDVAPAASPLTASSLAASSLAASSLKAGPVTAIPAAAIPQPGFDVGVTPWHTD